MERLLDFSDGSADSLRELATLYLDQTGEQLGQLQAAVRAGASPEVRRLAHSCAGASATCGVRRLVPLLRQLESQALERDLSNADELVRQAAAEFDRTRRFLEAYLSAQTKPAAKTQP
jgi:HPt (histidine-containing phosphotransfer) domain-containing protein